MEVLLRQVSSLEKIRPVGIGDAKALDKGMVMGGQSFSYQIGLQTPDRVEFTAQVDSPVAQWVHLYAVVNTVMDVACYSTADDDYITKEPGIMPDLLLPMEETELSEVFPLARMPTFLWASPSMTTEHTAYSSFSQVAMKLSQSSMTMSMV